MWSKLLHYSLASDCGEGRQGWRQLPKSEGGGGEGGGEEEEEKFSMSSHTQAYYVGGCSSLAPPS